MTMGQWVFGALILFGQFQSPAIAEQPSLESIENLLTELTAQYGEETSIEQALTTLSKRYPNFGLNYNLMHESRSRQSATPTHPRAILYTDDARFVLSFNGDPNASGFYELEMYEFSQDKWAEPNHPNSVTKNKTTYKPESFKFRRIKFKPRRDFFVNEPETVYPALKPINEQRCQGCHGRGNNLRPNWESYNRWEGSYFKSDRIHAGKKYLLGYETEASALFDKFYTNAAGKGRYKILQNLDEKYTVEGRRRANKTFRVDASQFSQVAGYLNYRRVAHTILATPNYDSYKWATLGALYNCQEFETFFPEKIRSEMRGSIEDYVNSTERIFKANANHFHLEHDHQPMGKFRYVFEGRGISMRRWNMNFRRSQYAFVTPGGDVSGFISTILAQYDPTLNPYQVWQLTGSDPYYGGAHNVGFKGEWTGSMTTMVAEPCKQLQKLSHQALSELNILIPKPGYGT